MAQELARRGVQRKLAGFRTEPRKMLERTGAMAAIGTDAVYPTLKSALNAFVAVQSGTDTSVSHVKNDPADSAGEQGAE